MGTITLAHSLAHALPPPGYNRQRPHCMVLTLANGGVYFFQAGTEELVNEWVSTCNYWAARQSKEPLVGGVSNMEYGWNRVVDPVTRARSISEDDYSIREADRESVRSGRSGRSGRSRFKEMAATVRADKSPWADRTFINDWKPPLPPSVPSMHDEETQLEALQKHVAHLKDDLQQHNELRTPMNQLVSVPSHCDLINQSRSRYSCSLRAFFIFASVPASVVERTKGADELGEEVAVSVDGNRQVRLVHRLPAGGDEPAAEEARRQGAGEGAGPLFARRCDWSQGAVEGSA